MINQERQRGALGDGNEIFHQPTLRRFAVVRSTTRIASAPAFSACLVSSTVSAKDCDPVAATTGTRFATTSTATLTSSVRSIGRETARFAGCSANDNSVRAFANLTLCQFGELPQIELAVPERPSAKEDRSHTEISHERHHKKITFPAAQVSSTRGPKIKARYAARLVEKPSFAPRDSMGWSRLSCQSKEPIQMFNGLSWIVNS